MALYRIASDAGVVMGVFAGATPEGAARVMHRDAGYATDPDVADVLGCDVDDISAGLIVEVADMVTTEEAALITGTDPSLWRSRCAARPGFAPIPGARKVGRDWQVPTAAVETYTRGPKGRPSKG